MEKMTREQLVEMGNDWMKMQFITREEHFSKLFTEVSNFDYISLLFLKRKMKQGTERLYLTEICEEMDLPMERVSKMVQHMQDHGYVYWRHNLSERPGTYITISETGEEALRKQRELIGDFFERAITTYGAEKFMRLVDLRREFNQVMEETLDYAGF